MIQLDTDHLSVLIDRDHARHAALAERLLAAAGQPFALPVVSVEEQLRGWLAFVHRLRDVHKQIPGYQRLARLFEFLHAWEIVPFEEPAADEFKRLRKQ